MGLNVRSDFRVTRSCQSGIGQNCSAARRDVIEEEKLSAGQRRRLILCAASAAGHRNPNTLTINGVSTTDSSGRSGSCHGCSEGCSCGKTLRPLASERVGAPADFNLIGTPAQVAEWLDEVMRNLGGDGFLISTPFQRISHRYVTKITDGLIPAPQARGLTRTRYTRATLRETLTEF